MHSVEEIEKYPKKIEVPCCRDFDEDCEDVPDKVHCYLYDPAKGMCPYLKEGNTDAQR